MSPANGPMSTRWSGALPMHALSCSMASVAPCSGLLSTTRRIVESRCGAISGFRVSAARGATTTISPMRLRCGTVATSSFWVSRRSTEGRREGASGSQAGGRPRTPVDVAAGAWPATGSIEPCLLSTRSQVRSLPGALKPCQQRSTYVVICTLSGRVGVDTRTRPETAARRPATLGSSLAGFGAQTPADQTSMPVRTERRGYRTAASSWAMQVGRRLYSVRS